MKKRLTIVFFIAFIVVFLVLSVVFFSLAHNSAKHVEEIKKSCTCETTAKVIDIHKERIMRSDDYSYSWYTTYEYYVDGKKLTKKSNVGSSRKIFDTGDSVKLYYNPDKVDQIYVAGEKVESSVTIFRIMGIGFGAVVIFAVFIIIFLWNKKVI